MLTWRETQVTCSKQCQGALERSQRNYPIDEWCRLYEAGTPYNRIAKEFGVSYGCVRRNIQAAGVPPRTDHEHLRKYDSQGWEKKPI